MTPEKHLIVASYVGNPTDSGYRARVRIELRSGDSAKRRIDYTHPRIFAELDDASGKGFELLGRWRRKYAPNADLIAVPDVP